MPKFQVGQIKIDDRIDQRYASLEEEAWVFEFDVPEDLEETVQARLRSARFPYSMQYRGDKRLIQIELPARICSTWDERDGRFESAALLVSVAINMELDPQPVRRPEHFNPYLRLP